MNKRLLKILISVGVAVVAIVVGIVIYSVAKSDEKLYRVLKVENYEGIVHIERDYEISEVFEGMNLKDKDIVTVGNESMVGILADSDKHIVADENTRFSIKAIGTEKAGKLAINLEFGSALFEIEEKLSDDSVFEVETPNATAGVRGTEFRVTYLPDKNETIVNVYKGKVEVTSIKMSMMVEPGQSVKVNSVGDIVFMVGDEDDNDNDATDNNIANNDNADGDDSNSANLEKAPNYIEKTAFDLSQFMGEDGRLWVKQLENWEYLAEDSSAVSMFEFEKDGVTISYDLIYQNRGLFSVKFMLDENCIIDSKVLYNADGEEVVFDKLYIKEGYCGVQNAYAFIKQISDEIKVVIYVYDRDRGESLAKCDIDTFVELTTNKYFSDTYLSNIEGVEDENAEAPVVDDAFLDKVKGGISIQQLELLLEMGLSKNNSGYPDYLASSLFYGGSSLFTPLEVTTDGSYYDLSELNTFLSIITDERLTSGGTYSYATVVGDKLHVRVRDVASGGSVGISIDKKNENDNGEIVIEYTYQKTYGSDVRSGEDGTAAAYFVTNEAGEYVMDRVEILTSQEWTEE